MVTAQILRGLVYADDVKAAKDGTLMRNCCLWERGCMSLS